MFPFLKFKKRGIVVVDNNKRNLGRVPVQIARELVDRKQANIVHNHPTIIGLRQVGKVRAEDANRVNSANPLKNLISVASLFVSKGNRIPALNSVLFKIDNNRLCVITTNLDTYFEGFVESDKGFVFTRNNAADGVCINAFHVKKILSCPDESSSIYIRSGKTPGLQIGSFFVEGFSPDEFPGIQSQKESKTYPFTITDIAKKLNFVGSAISDNKYRSSLCGVFFDLSRQRLVCADGIRLHMVPMVDAENAKGNNSPQSGVIIPAQVIRVAKYLTGNGKLIENSENRRVILDLNIPGCVNCVAGFNEVDAKFPDYESVIPKDFTSKFTVNTKDILPVLHRATIANTTDSDARPIITAFNNGILKITTKVHERITYQGIVHGRYSGMPYRGIINAGYLTDAIEGMQCDLVEILLQGENDKAWVIRNGSGYTAVIMPIEIENPK